MYKWSLAVKGKKPHIELCNYHRICDFTYASAKELTDGPIGPQIRPYLSLGIYILTSMVLVLMGCLACLVL